MNAISFNNEYMFAFTKTCVAMKNKRLMQYTDNTIKERSRTTKFVRVVKLVTLYFMPNPDNRRNISKCLKLYQNVEWQQISHKHRWLIMRDVYLEKKINSLVIKLKIDCIICNDYWFFSETSSIV